MKIWWKEFDTNLAHIYIWCRAHKAYVYLRVGENRFGNILGNVLVYTYLFYTHMLGLNGINKLIKGSKLKWGFSEMFEHSDQLGVISGFICKSIAHLVHLVCSLVIHFHFVSVPKLA